MNASVQKLSIEIVVRVCFLYLLNERIVEFEFYFALQRGYDNDEHEHGVWCFVDLVTGGMSERSDPWLSEGLARATALKVERLCLSHALIHSWSQLLRLSPR